MNKLTIERESPTTAVVRRRFDAAPEKVYDAHILPELVKVWMLGPEGWSMPVCESDPRPGGHIRYEWENAESGASFFLTGEFELLDRPHRIVHVERMHLPDPTPTNRVETTFEPDGTGTLMTMKMTLPDADSLDAMLETGMADGMEMSFRNLDATL